MNKVVKNYLVATAQVTWWFGTLAMFPITAYLFDQYGMSFISVCVGLVAFVNFTVLAAAVKWSFER